MNVFQTVDKACFGRSPPQLDVGKGESAGMMPPAGRLHHLLYVILRYVCNCDCSHPRSSDPSLNRTLSVSPSMTLSLG